MVVGGVCAADVVLLVVVVPGLVDLWYFDVLLALVLMGQ